MASIIPGYEYDIFISYRQKDNKHDGWVTEFVNNLKGELESVFKEEISVYFDINPHNGLLETHDVNASLKEKLKCLIFIPIISRTYCDPKSFAWEHEFKAFIKEASRDKFGLKVKLPGGNVANRVLPVQIHDLDIEDKKLVESELGGFIRGIEFIYKEPGVNRPLKPDDDEKINLNKSKYRNQINKVGNATKEIISSLKTCPSEIGIEKETQHKESFSEKGDVHIPDNKKNSVKLKSKSLLPVALILVFITVAAVIIYPKIFKHDTIEELRSSGKRISVAVMPFLNMTNDTTLNTWQSGIQFNIISFLSNFTNELIVYQKENINNLLDSKGFSNYSAITPSSARMVSNKLQANIFIYGSIYQVREIIRLNAQVIDSKTEKSIKSFIIDYPYEHILSAIDSLSKLLKNSLIVYNLGKEVTPELLDYSSTNSPEAFLYFVYGTDAFAKADFASARKMFIQSIAADSNYLFPYIQLSFAYGNDGLYDDAKKWCLKIYHKKEQLPPILKLMADLTYSRFFETPNEEIKSLHQFILLTGEAPMLIWNIGNAYTRLGQYHKAIPEYEKSIEICKKWGIKPFWVFYYTFLGSAYHETGQYDKEKLLYKQAEQDYPDNHFLIYREAVLALSERDTIKGQEFINEFIVLQKENKVSEADLVTDLAEIFSEAGYLDKAEKLYRQALLLQPENHVRINNLAFFLIDRNININEGLILADRALQLKPDDYKYIHTKGWGLYKLGKFSEGLEFLSKSWELKPDYFQYLNDHLEIAKKAVAGQKKDK